MKEFEDYWATRLPSLKGIIEDAVVIDMMKDAAYNAWFNGKADAYNTVLSQKNIIVPGPYDEYLGHFTLYPAAPNEYGVAARAAIVAFSLAVRPTYPELADRLQEWILKIIDQFKNFPDI